MNRLLMLSALLALAPVANADDDFSGAWVASLCPPGVQRESGQCASFVLELHQQGDRLCGAHLFSTAGAERIDEGAAPSISGEISDGVANAVAVSGRAPIRVRAEIRKTGAMLQWLRQENPSGDYLLPPSARLTKARKKTLFAPVFEQELKAACSSVFAMAAEAARKKAQQPAPDASGQAGAAAQPAPR